MTARLRTTSGKAGERVLAIGGRLDADSTGAVWRDALAAARGGAGALVVDASELEYCDGTGAVLLATLRATQQRAGGRFELRGLRADLERLVDLVQPSPAQAAPIEKPGMLASLGRASLAVLADVYQLVAFIGELALALVDVVRHPAHLRLKDALEVADRAGLGATPIIVLVGFLLGLILAFQGAIPMQRFGAQVFVADLLGISMLRELGPLMASILLTARSGSAFAAEIGTMKVNEEIDALTTMGVEPVRFLVVPRVIAALSVVPALAMLTSLSGLLGGALVFVSLGFPLVIYIDRIVESVTVGDVLGGLFKALVFGVIVAAIGCQRGLATGQGAGAVGVSTTSSVVSGIILIAVADGIFAVAYYILGI
jgi:phospholipid/cholesterol/gamma-HCH transport system permease protein